MFDSGEVEVADLIKAGLVRIGDEWRYIPRRNRGAPKVMTSATITEHGLRIGASGFGSPSRAARAVVGSPRNGWKFWRFEKNGEWVYVDELRQQLLRRRSRRG